jgi:hypothetical protein
MALQGIYFLDKPPTGRHAIGSLAAAAMNNGGLFDAFKIAHRHLDVASGAIDRS